MHRSTLRRDPGGPGNVLDDFEVDEGHFNWPYNQSPASQTFGLSSATTIDRVTDDAHRGVGSQQLNLVASGAGNWQVRHNSGLGQVGAPQRQRAARGDGLCRVLAEDR